MVLWAATQGVPPAAYRSQGWEPAAAAPVLAEVWPANTAPTRASARASRTSGLSRQVWGDLIDMVGLLGIGGRSPFFA
ncbi:hypothetical protein GCM10018772_62170 [Streptomyces fumanus]|uniref:Uncharacterized protein n=1 Tax=Streptomyces fumanus TaxID=67302 RepID=A0A919AXN0_9ACTN|nr:hypothetical protein GCM10018772_62170 [Streptomyces fumanus]